MPQKRFQDFAASKIAKWLIAGLSVVLATAFIIPLLKQFQFIQGLTAGMGAIAVSLMLLGIALVAGFFFRNQLGQFLAAGLGVAAFINVLMVVLGGPLGQLRAGFMKTTATVA